MDVSLLQLPDEVFGVILGFLNDKDRFERFSNVNRRCFHLAYSSPLPYVSLNSAGIFGNRITEIISAIFEEIKSCLNVKEANALFVKLFRSCIGSIQAFSRLNLGSVTKLNIDRFLLAGLEVIAENFPNLEELMIMSEFHVIPPHISKESSYLPEETTEEDYFSPFFSFPKLKCLTLMSYSSEFLSLPFHRLEELDLDLAMNSVVPIVVNNTVLEALTKACNLTSLVVPFAFDLTALVNLTHLDLKLRSLEDVKYLENARCPNLKSLKISMNHGSVDYLSFPHLNHFKKSLKSLEISRSLRIEAEHVSELDLEALYLWNFLPGLMKPFAHMENIEDLAIYSLGISFVTDEDYEILSRLRKLKKLSFSGQVEVERLSRIIENNALERLTLDQYGARVVLSYDDIRNILSKLDPNALEFLTLFKCRVDSEAMTLLGRLNNLRELMISVDQECDVSDEWLAAVASISNLRLFDLHHELYVFDVEEEDGDNGATAGKGTLTFDGIVRTFTALPEMHHLHLSYVTRGIFLEELEVALPHIELITLAQKAY